MLGPGGILTFLGDRRSAKTRPSSLLGLSCLQRGRGSPQGLPWPWVCSPHHTTRLSLLLRCRVKPGRHEGAIHSCTPLSCPWE